MSSPSPGFVTRLTGIENRVLADQRVGQAFDLERVALFNEQHSGV